MQLGLGHCDPCGSVHRVLGTRSLRKAFDAPHCLRAVVGGNAGISYPANSSAKCQSPAVVTVAFVPMSSHSHNLLGVTPEGNTTLTRCWGSLPFQGAKRAYQRSCLARCWWEGGGRWRQMQAAPAERSWYFALCFLLPWIPWADHLNSASKHFLASICKKGPFCSPGASCFVEGDWWMRLPCPIHYHLHLTVFSLIHPLSN